jgi:hypothetical protein
VARATHPDDWGLEQEPGYRPGLVDDGVEIPVAIEICDKRNSIPRLALIPRNRDRKCAKVTTGAEIIRANRKRP